MPTLSLDIGCGPKPKNYFNADEVYGLDVRNDLENKVYMADLIIEPIPFADGFFDFVTCHDFIEHIPPILYSPHRRYPFIEVMNEIWRVLKPDGKFYSLTPAFPSSAAFFDPTHVNYITEQTFPTGFGSNQASAKAAGFCGSFEVESQAWQGPHLASVLRKISLASAA